MEEQLTIHEQIELLEKLTQNTTEYRPTGEEKTEQDYIDEILVRRRNNTPAFNDGCIYEYSSVAINNSDFARICRRIESCFGNLVKGQLQIELDGSLKRNYLINGRKTEVVSDLRNARIIVRSGFCLDEWLNEISLKKSNIYR